MRSKHLLVSLVSAGLFLLVLGLIYSLKLLRDKQKTINNQNQKLSVLNETKNRIFTIIGHDLRGSLFSFQGLQDQIDYLLETGHSKN